MKRKIAVSACLLGHKTRYDGKEKHADLSWLGDDVEFIPVCPEVEAGFGIPRPKIELVQGESGEIAVERIDDRENMSVHLLAACERLVRQLKEKGVDGFVLKSNSPSCGLSSPLHDKAGNVIGYVPGLWAAAIIRVFPELPCSEV